MARRKLVVVVGGRDVTVRFIRKLSSVNTVGDDHPSEHVGSAATKLVSASTSQVVFGEGGSRPVNYAQEDTQERPKQWPRQWIRRWIRKPPTETDQRVACVQI